MKKEIIREYLDSRGKYDPRKSEARRAYLKALRAKREKVPHWGDINPRLIEADGIDKFIMRLAEYLSAKTH